MGKALRSLSPAMVVACVALFVALTGTSVAVVSALPKNSVGTAQLKNGAVTSVKVKAGSLKASNFATGQLPAGTAGPAGPAGPAGAAGAPGPSNAYSAWKNGPDFLHGTFETIGTLKLPAAGKYVVFAKTWIYDTENGGVIVDCRLTAGADWDDSQTALTGHQGKVVSTATLELNVVHEFAAADSATVSCKIASGSDMTQWNFVKITAIKVGDLTNGSA
jgi:hypothetical protein